VKITSRRSNRVENERKRDRDGRKEKSRKRYLPIRPMVRESRPTAKREKFLHWGKEREHSSAGARLGAMKKGA